jgi:hypothetical protein
MGKSVVIYIIGLSLLVSYGLMNINANSVASIDTFHHYYGGKMSHNLAITGANIGTQLLTRNPAYSGDMVNQQFGTGGWFDMRVTKTGDEATVLATSRYQTLICPEYPDGYMRDTVIASFRRISFCEYGWFSDGEKDGYLQPDGSHGPYFGGSDWKITGDSVFGRAHTNNKFNLAGTPYFSDKVTALHQATVIALNGVAQPVFASGYQWGIIISRPTTSIVSLKTMASAGRGINLPLDNIDVGLEFHSDGNVRLRVPFNTGAIADTLVPLTTLSTNGVVGIVGGDLHVKGTYHGQVTMCAFKGTWGTGLNKGNIWIEGDLVAADDPRVNISSADLAGMVAERMVYIRRDDARTSASVLTIEAAIYAHEGEFAAERYWEPGIHGRVSLFGGVTQATAGSMGVFSAAGLVSGFAYSIRYDPRFQSVQPPAFPSSDKYKLVGWWEN